MEKNTELCPVTPQSLITEENVRKTLLADKGKDTRLIDWRVVDFTRKGDNYATFVTSVEVKYSLNNQTNDVTYIVKLNPCRELEHFHIFADFVFKREVGFYMELQRELNSILEEAGLEPLNTPKGFYADLQKKNQQLYLADMRPLGFKMFDKRKGMDPSHVSLVMKEMGKLHASSFLLEHKNKEATETRYEFLSQNSNFSENEKSMAIFEGFLGNAIALLKKVPGYERAVSWAESLKPREIFSTAEQSNLCNVIIHGDCWTNNIIFKYNEAGDPEQLMLLDLQGCRKASFAIDLNYFLYTSLNADVRKTNIAYFLSLYYDTFQNTMRAGGLQMPFTRDELTKEFREKNIIGGFFGMMVFPLILFEPEDVPDFTVGTNEEFKQLMATLDAKSVQMVEKSPMLKPRFLSMFDEFMEQGLIP